MKTIILLFALINLGVSGIYAQNDTIVSQTTAQQGAATIDEGSSSILGDFLEFAVNRSKKPRQGKSYRGWWSEAYFGLGFVAGNIANSDARIIHGASYSIDFGVKSIYRINGIYALTFNTGLMHNRYKIADGMSNNIIGNSIEVLSGDFKTNSESFRTWAFGLSLGNRFNFYKTRKTGHYLEASIYGNYVFSREYNISYKMENNASASVSYKSCNNLFHPFEAGAQVNLGLRWFNVWGRYRFTNWFDSAQTDAKLPRFVIGFGFTP